MPRCAAVVVVLLCHAVGAHLALHVDVCGCRVISARFASDPFVEQGRISRVTSGYLAIPLFLYIPPAYTSQYVQTPPQHDCTLLTDTPPQPAVLVLT